MIWEFENAVPDASIDAWTFADVTFDPLAARQIENTENTENTESGRMKAAGLHCTATATGEGGDLDELDSSRSIATDDPPGLGCTSITSKWITED